MKLINKFCVLSVAAVVLLLTACTGGETQCEGEGCGTPTPEMMSSACRDNTNCQVGFVCVSGSCQMQSGCTDDSQCPSGEQCIEGGCYVIDPPDVGRPDTGSPTPDPVPDAGMDAGDTCEGCVQMTDQGELCLPGTFDNACGAGGEECVDCGEGRSCAEGQCVETITCGPENCEGCCNGETCEVGTTDFACGGGGLQCQRCTNGASCEDRQCIIPCGPDNCTGCCDGDGNCDSFGDFDDSCGLGGENCEVCSGDQRCDSGDCIDLTCSETCDGCCSGDTCLAGTSSQDCGFGGSSCIDCGPGRLCRDSECRIDERSRWDILVLGADVSTTNSNGDAWDAFGGNPDPYIKLLVTDFIEETEEQSDVIDDTTTPFWFERVIEDVSADALMTRIEIRVYDSDFNSDDLMSACSTSMTEELFTGDTLSITCDGGGDLTEATVRFQVQRH